MAATVTANLTDITLGESGDDTYWTGEDGYQSEVFRQGSSAQGWIVAKNGNETAIYDAYTSNSSAVFDMSGTDVHLYISIRCDIAPFMDYLRFALQSDTAHGSSTSGTTWWTIVDNTTNLEWFGEWKTFILDVNDTNTDADSSGTLDLAAITDIHINVDNSNSGNIRSIENTYIDTIRFGTGLTVTGTTWDWADVAAIDAANNATDGYNKWEIIREVGPGVFEVQGRLTIGNGTTTTTPSSSNETLYFKDPSVSGEAGGRQGYVGSGLYGLRWEGSGCTCTFSNVSILASTSTPFFLDADDTNLPTSSLDWDGGTISGGGLTTLKSSQSVKNLSFVGCGQVDPSTATFTGCKFIDYVGTEGGALLWPTSGSVSGCDFVNCDEGVEIAQTTTQSFTDMTFDDAAGNYDVHLNNGGTSITVDKDGTSNPNSYTATGGGTVTFSGSVPITITVVDSDNVAITTAAVRVEETDGTQVAQGTVNGSGVYSTTYSGSTPLSVRIKVRSSSSGETRYFPVRTSSTIASETGLVATISMSEDTIVV